MKGISGKGLQDLALDDTRNLDESIKFVSKFLPKILSFTEYNLFPKLPATLASLFIFFY